VAVATARWGSGGRGGGGHRAARERGFAGSVGDISGERRGRLREKEVDAIPSNSK
jgi:hypothetical protein